jgi:hypothetical protein
MPPFEPTRRKAAALFFLAPALAATPALAAAPSGKKAAATQKTSGPPQRQAFTTDEQQIASIPGIPDARFFGDADTEFLEAVRRAEGPWLALSGGGEDGAFGAGVLAGLSAKGARPEFAVVTGASTGALMAPYVFLGSRYDDALRRIYTETNAGDVFELAATPESLFDTWPLKKTIQKSITTELLAEIATEHRKGRRLFAVTTNLDAGRPVVWNLGAIAARGGETALNLFRDVLLASSSIPGFFPPVHIAVEANGKAFKEMHADGSIRAPFYVAPDGILAGRNGARLPAKQLYVLVNNKLNLDFQVTESSVPGVLSRSISIALKMALRSDLARVGATAQRQGIELAISLVPPAFNVEARGAFDPNYMQALFEFGARQAQSGAAFGRDALAAIGAATITGG